MNELIKQKKYTGFVVAKLFRLNVKTGRNQI